MRSFYYRRRITGMSDPFSFNGEKYVKIYFDEKLFNGITYLIISKKDFIINFPRKRKGLRRHVVIESCCVCGNVCTRSVTVANHRYELKCSCTIDPFSPQLRNKYCNSYPLSEYANYNLIHCGSWKYKIWVDGLAQTCNLSFHVCVGFFYC